MEKKTCRRLMSATADGRITNLIDDGLRILLCGCIGPAFDGRDLSVNAKSLLTMAADARSNGYYVSALRCYRRAIEILSDSAGNARHRRLNPLLTRAWSEYHALAAALELIAGSRTPRLPGHDS